MVPHTSDGRVMFAIPWHGHTLVGTTDTPIATPTLEPRPLPEEIEFILETAGQYLLKPPTRDDVLSVFVGIRPLVKSGDGKLTAALSRDHTIHFDASGLLTTTGGKWTTYRNMAEHTVDQAADFARLAERPCVTRTLNVHGFHSNADRFGALSVYGSDAARDPGSDARDAVIGGTTPCAAALHRRRSRLGGAARDGADGRRRARAAHARAVPQRARRGSHGARGRAADGRRTWLGRVAAGRRSRRIRDPGQGIPDTVFPEGLRPSDSPTRSLPPSPRLRRASATQASRATSSANNRSRSSQTYWHSPAPVLVPQRRPLRVGVELRPDIVTMRAIAIRQHPDERVGIAHVLPDADDLGAMLLKIATSCSRNRWCSSLMPPLKFAVPTRLWSTV